MSDSSGKRPERVVIKRAVIREGQVVEADSPETATLIEEQIRRGHAREERRREVWGSDNVEQIARLARSFPTLRDAGGLEPWDPVDFLDWSLSPARTSGSWHASMFVLSVWNQTTDWSEVARENGWLAEPREVDNLSESAKRLGLAKTDAEVRALDPKLVDRAEHALRCAREFTFHATNALSVWDEEHAAAFLAWWQLPFWP